MTRHPWASDADRRAIADADQAGRLDVSGETNTPQALRTPEFPTDAARKLHNMTHHSETGADSANVEQEVRRTNELW